MCYECVFLLETNLSGSIPLSEREFVQSSIIRSFLHVTLAISIDELMVGFDEWYMLHLWLPLVVAIDLTEYDDC